jgi:GntP family gluconate:H+ symporter
MVGAFSCSWTAMLAGSTPTNGMAVVSSVSGVGPLIILAVGIGAVLGMIVVLRMPAFLPLICAALLVSLLAPGAIETKCARVAQAFGAAASKFAIVIALAAVVGKCMLDSRAADRIVEAFVGILGERRAAAALLCSGFVLAIPVFFDTVFYLLVPLARSFCMRTGRDYLLYVMAIVAGGAVTHTLVPPTPGPLTVAGMLNVDLGIMIVVGSAIGVPAAGVGLVFCRLLNRWMPVTMRPLLGEQASVSEEPDRPLPPLIWSALPLVLPVLLISTPTVVEALVETSERPAAVTLSESAEKASSSALSGAPTSAEGFLRRLARYTALLGDPNMALLLAAAVAMSLYIWQRRPTREELSEQLESALTGASLIILITAGGGAFGAMLQEAQVGTAVEQLLDPKSGWGGSGILGLAFLLSAVLKVAQGSSTVAMITTAGMILAMLPSTDALPFHPVYLATSIGAGSLVGSWMNDSGFWIYAKMGGLTEAESLKSWTPLLTLLGLTSFAVTLLLATCLPLK